MQSERDYVFSASERGSVDISALRPDPKDAALGANLPKRMTDLDGTPVDVFPLPTDSASLESLLRDLFENHWREITFGPIIQGAAWEMRADRAPTYVGVLDGYLTIAFGVPHFHICIGETKGTRNRPTSPELAAHRRTSRAELYRTRERSCVQMSWGLRLFNGAGEQQITVLLPNPFLTPRRTGFSSNRTGPVLPCGTSSGRAGLA